VNIVLSELSIMQNAFSSPNFIMHAGLWFPSSRVQTRPKPLDFFCVQNPQHAFLRRGS
jgi:hypothetical protein